MQALQPDQARFLLDDVFLPQLRDEHKATISVIEAIPLDKGEFQPDPIARPALDLAWHVVAAEDLFIGAILEGAFTFKPRPRPQTINTSADLSAYYAASFERHLTALTEISNDHLIKLIDFRGMVNHSAVLYLDFVIRHAVHHRGQLTMYLRPMGAKVPAIYGESYDSNQAKKAALQSV